MKKSKKLLTVAAASGAALLGAGELLYRFALDRRFIGKMMQYQDAVGEEVEDAFRNSQIVKDGNEWYENAHVENIAAYSPRGEHIHAEMICTEKESDLWAICIHGYTADPKANAVQGMMFQSWGYNLIFPSLCGHGDSECPYVAMGWYDRLDICEWIRFICEINPNSKIVLYGVSMGAATVMMTTGERLPENVVCAIEDCGYSSVDDEFRAQITEVFHLPAFPFLNAADFMTKLHTGYGFKEASSIEQLKKSKTPTLFIHGDADTFVPFCMLDKCYDAAACEKEKLVIEGADHACSLMVNPELYFGTIKSFTEKYISSDD